jgi:uncharacterized membrane protein
MSESLKNSSDCPSENGGSEDNPGEVEPVGDQSSEEIVVAVQRALQGFFYEYQWSGPLPPPADFAAYKEVLESAPERIMRLAEEGSSHHVGQGVRRDRLAGRVVTGFFFILFAAFALAGYLAHLGYDVTAAVTGLTPVVATLVTVFFRWWRRRERD